MGLAHGANIVNDGLIFSVDPINPRSWTGPDSNSVNDLINKSPGDINNDTSGSFGISTSFVFDGVTDYINFPSYTLLPAGNESFSVSCWYRRSGNRAYAGLVTWGNYEHREEVFWFHNGTGDKLGFGFVNNDPSQSDFISLDLNVWYNTTLTYNGSIARMYINGVERLTYSPLSLLIPSSTSIRMGVVNGYYLEGNLSGIKIYNRTLTVPEIKQNYNALKGRFGL